MLKVLDSAPSLTRDLKRRRDGTWSLGKGNHPIMTRPANKIHLDIEGADVDDNFVFG